jgi:prepilin-type N-terminal cleavage/methylation domain-containing protein
MVRRMRNDESGFTLIEMLVTMIIMAVLSIALANFIVNYLQGASLAQARSNLLTNAETALDTVASDIRLSGSVDANNRWADVNGPSGQQFGWASGTQTLILAKIATTNTHSVIYSDASKYITQKDDEVYFLSGTTLYRRTLASGTAGDSATTTCPAAKKSGSCPADMVVATGVKSWAVSYYDVSGTSTTAADARAVQLAITLSSSTGGQTTKASYTTRMVFRND